MAAKKKKPEVVLGLRELRYRAGKTQAEVAQTLGMSRTLLSKFERDPNLLLNLRRTVEALGGALEVTVVFKNRRIRLKGV
jgi:transcriptional regulator with XRE-family HTH domain